MMEQVKKIDYRNKTDVQTYNIPERIVACGVLTRASESSLMDPTTAVNLFDDPDE